MSKAVVLYLHVHQPYRVRHYTVFDVANRHDYFDADYDDRTSNERIIHKVAEKSYLPTNRRLLQLLQEHPEFRLSLSITGTVIEQLERWAPHVLQSFQDLTATGRVEIVAETFHHSLAFFYERDEFETQVRMHREKVQQVFGQTPQVFRNTETLGWRSPNYMYRPAYTNDIRLLMKNYRLSDDIAFRFGDQNWSGWPLTADKFSGWLNDSPGAQVFNLFMDYETFGEHQWEASGIFDFLDHLPKEWLKAPGNSFMTVSEAIDAFEPVDYVDVPDTITWADTERDLSAWLGNGMQAAAINAMYDLKDAILNTGDLALIEDWRRLQTSDHFYYMCTKWFNDGDIHAYFSPYENPYDAYLAFMNAYHDLRFRLNEKGVPL